MSNPSLINEDDLKSWLGYDQRAAIERWLSERSIPFEICKNKIVTTVQAINNGLIGIKQESSGFEFE